MTAPTSVKIITGSVEGEDLHASDKGYQLTQSFLETRKEETCRTEPMEKESSKKTIQTQGRKLTVQYGNFHAECSFKYWGNVTKRETGKMGTSIHRRLRVGTECKELQWIRKVHNSLERADLRGYH